MEAATDTPLPGLASIVIGVVKFVAVEITRVVIDTVVGAVKDAVIEITVEVIKAAIITSVLVIGVVASLDAVVTAKPDNIINQSHEKDNSKLGGEVQHKVEHDP